MAKKKVVRKKGFRIIHLILIILMVYVAVVLNNQRILLNDLLEKKELAEREISQLESEINRLNGEIEKSGTLEFIEKIARDELGMVKPREIIYIDKSNLSPNIFKELKGDN